MSDRFTLIYRGEVNEGQHAAVVRKRLQALLKLDDGRMDRLFSGQPVALKKSVDQATAARFQAAFKKAGAVLRVSRAQPAAEPQEEAAATPQTPDALSVLPAGSDVLSPEERSPEVHADVQTDHIKLEGAVFVMPEEPEEIGGPDVDHISLAEPGAVLAPDAPDPELPELDVDFDLAEVGADIGQASHDDSRLPELDVNFDLAEPGARIGSGTAAEPPPAPDTSHITLEQPNANTEPQQ